MVESTKTGSEEFGATVRRARERLGMTRRDLAETTGLSYPYVSQIETGYRMPSTAAMRSLADALGLRPDRLFDAIPSAADRDAASGRPVEPGPATPLADPPVPAPAPPMVNRPSAAAPPPAPSAGARRAGPAAGATGGGATGGGAPAGSATAGAPLDAAAAGGGWITNARARPIVARTAAPAAATESLAQVIDRATALLNSLPTAERLPALSEVQERVVRSVVDDQVRRGGRQPHQEG